MIRPGSPGLSGLAAVVRPANSLTNSRFVKRGGSAP
jgi:hypothetical protein